MKQKRIAIIMFIIALLLIFCGLLFSLFFNNKLIQNDNNKTNKTIESEIINYDDKSKKSIDLESISTDDRSIVISKTKAFYVSEMFGVGLDITSNQSYNELYLIFTFELENSSVQIPMLLLGINANEVYKTELQYNKDLTNAKSWSVKKVTKEDALNAGLLIN